MTHGVDTDFLIAVEIRDHPFHRGADQLLTRLLRDGHDLAVAPQTLAEFIHVVTDAKRMPQPLSISEAIQKAENWWHAVEVQRVFPDGQVVNDFLGWLASHHLGRKRLLDTMLASTFKHAGVMRLITNNERDYAVFGCFEIVTYGS